MQTALPHICDHFQMVSPVLKRNQSSTTPSTTPTSTHKNTYKSSKRYEDDVFKGESVCLVCVGLASIYQHKSI